MRLAIIDMGTNTFNLIVGELKDDGLRVVYQNRIFVKIGKDGISKGLITDDAIERMMKTLIELKKEAERFNVIDITATATSAMRSAKNGAELVEKIYNELGITVTTIDGEEEARLIYTGVKTALNLSKTPSLILDIGGGSVEFILADNVDILWKKSFEIGAQRLYDKFHNDDPISVNSISHLNAYLEDVLDEVLEQILVLKPKTIIGCAGTFSTIKTIHCLQEGTLDKISIPDYPMSIGSYLAIHEEIISKNLEERIAIPGMLEERADMIVVASCIVSYLLENFAFDKIRITTAALKDGLLWEKLNEVN
ncbi:exopolyphosphatase [Chondrinema litorale]|uniref:Ppx/GppA phosphatase family protein n=1 Tax=Chondrinema litorale TaxID=2994555 RepID=UPI0025427222|nr:exopolyphosphatase [Chondrinema litorale]UZR95807.1 exopolyphosphatase [Chondrinema litorale]